MRLDRFRQRGRVATHSSRLQATVIAVIMLAFFAPIGASAAPSQPTNPLPVADAYLGGGSYTMTASVFGTPGDGLIGNSTSSGFVLKGNDNVVALPACTESSCPWVPLGTGTEGRYGPQTTCAESDGLCYVQVVSNSTGMCAVAPVHDRGPLFVRDNWWAPQSEREYNLPRGVLAAEAARDGANFGFGAGISDAGHDIKNVYRYAAGIDLANGTWNKIGLATSAGIGSVTVTLLWQAGISSDDACNGAGPGTPGGGGGGGTTTPNANATVSSSLNLRASSNTNSQVITIMPGGARIRVTGGSQNGFYPLTYGTRTGYGYAQFINLDSGASLPPAPGSGNGTFATTTSNLNLRPGPSTGFAPKLVMPSGARVELTGKSQSGYLGVVYNGTAGWASSQYLSTSGGGTAGPPDPGTGNGTFATTTSSLNLRPGPATTYAPKLVMPSGARVELTGKSQGGFLGVIYNGTKGWASAQFLSTSGGGSTTGPPDPGAGNGTFATTTSNLNLRSGPATTYAVKLVIPSGGRVELTGKSQGGYLGVIYNGTKGWASSQFLSTSGGSSSAAGGNTATVFDGTLRLRSGPSTSSAILLVMPDGAVVTLLGESENGFAKVSYKGTIGWASEEFLD